MIRVVVLCTLLLATTALSPACRAQSEPTGAKVVYIAIENEGVDCGELFNVVSSEMHWVAGSLTAFSRAFGVESTSGGRLNRKQIDELTTRFPTVFSYREDNNERQSLAVDVDALAVLLADKKSNLRKWLAGLQNQPLASLDKVHSTWDTTAPAPRRIIVVMAGLHGIESTSEAVAVKLHEQTNLPTCVFGYPNDAPISESAGLLVVQLQDLHNEYPKSRVTLVTHSMGGLVSRAALEMESLDTAAAGTAQRSSIAERTGVDQLIQVCPPNHGSALAEYGPLLEGAEQLYRLVNRSGERKSHKLFGTIIDGFNEAPADLKPNSAFLVKLNQCQRNPAVEYTILAGTEGPLRSGMTTLLSNLWERVATSVDEPQELDRRITEVLACAELQNGKGDGVVALDSAKLDGVADLEVMKMHHLVWNELDSTEGRAMLQEVASRIGISL